MEGRNGVRYHSPVVHRLRENGSHQNLNTAEGEGSSCIWYHERKQEDNPMSFVGLTIKEDRIIAFADTRSSVPLPNGGFTCDNSQKLVHKIIQKGNGLLVLYGANRVPYCQEGIPTSLCPIGKPLQEIEADTPVQALIKLYESIQGPQWGEACGYTADWQEGMWNLGRFSISQGFISFEKIPIETIPYAVYGGDSFFCEYFKRDKTTLLGNEAEIKSQIGTWLDTMEQTGLYQTVGRPIEICTLPDRGVRDLFFIPAT